MANQRDQLTGRTGLCCSILVTLKRTSFHVQAFTCWFGERWVVTVGAFSDDSACTRSSGSCSRSDTVFDSLGAESALQDSLRDRLDMSLAVGFVKTSEDTRIDVLRIVRYVCFLVLTHMLCNLPVASGLWLGPARVIMTEAVQQWSGSVHSTTGEIGVVWGVARKQADQMSSYSAPSMQ